MIALHSTTSAPPNDRAHLTPAPPSYLCLAPLPIAGGVLAITARTGQVLLLTLNTETVVPYVTNVLKNTSLAMALAGRLGLGGADELYTQQFQARCCFTGRTITARPSCFIYV